MGEFHGSGKLKIDVKKLKSQNLLKELPEKLKGQIRDLENLETFEYEGMWDSGSLTGTGILTTTDKTQSKPSVFQG